MTNSNKKIVFLLCLILQVYGRSLKSKYYPSQDQYYNDNDDFKISKNDVTFNDQYYNEDLVKNSKNDVTYDNGYIDYSVNDVLYKEEYPIYDNIGSNVYPIEEDDEKIYNLSKDVDPVSGKELDDISDNNNFWGWLRTVDDKVGDKWNKFTDNTKDKFNTFVDNAGNVIEEVDKSFDNFKDEINKKAQKVGAVLTKAVVITKDHANTVWEKTKENIPTIWEHFKEYLKKFGYEVEHGARYIKEKCEQILNEAKGTDILRKLEEKLKKGDDYVAAFFTCIGRKLSDWSQAKKVEGMDDGLNENPSINSHDNIHNEHFDDPSYPNMLEDSEVLDHLHTLYNQGILEKEDIEALYQTSNSHGEENLDFLQQWSTDDRKLL